MEGSRVDAGLLLQGVGGLAGQGGTDDIVAGVAVGLGDGRRGGGLVGAGAADDGRPGPRTMPRRRRPAGEKFWMALRRAPR
jgi:hypothetical protein